MYGTTCSSRCYISIRITLVWFLVVTIVSCWCCCAFQQRQLPYSLVREKKYTTNSEKPLHAERKNEYNDRFSDDLITALDLVPVMDMVTSYCGTYRGQQAILKVVGQDDISKRTRASEKRTGRIPWQSTSYSNKRQRYDDEVIPTLRNDIPVNENDVLFQSNENSFSPTELSNNDHGICPIAKSAEEVMEMYHLVAEATRCLDGTAINGTFPPIYPSDAPNGPFDIATRKGNVIASDDDEFLQFTTAKDERWTLEHILQADQVIAKLISLYDWSITSTPCVDDKHLQGIASLVVGTVGGIRDGIDIKRLVKVWLIIHDTVEIVRVRTLTDAWGQTTYQFRLKNQKFPILPILRDRCELFKEEKLQSKGTLSNRQEQELYDMEQELVRKELEIKLGLIQSVHSIRSAIDNGLNILATVDVLFAKAAFGVHMGANVNQIDATFMSNDENGFVHVQKFIHPLLGRPNDASVVPIDLYLGKDYQSLIISGSNGGGKSVAMKSFGLVSVLAKLGIPIVANSIDSLLFFDEVLVSVGDYQNVERGESTYISQLLRHSSLIDIVGSTMDKSYLVLLDELGSGTEEASGGAIGQAIVEKFRETKSCFVVATTHSPIIKAWSFNSANVGSAAVLLQSTRDDRNDLWKRRPSYQLQYGCIGESYALGAASRCLSEEIVSRASAILEHNQVNSNNAGYTSNLTYNIAITKSLEKQLELATERALETEDLFQDTAMLQRAMISLANAYDRHLSRLEQRIELCYQSLKQEQNNDQAEVTEHVLGETLAELRIIRKTVKREQDILRERGLKRLRDNDELSIKQNVVVIDSSSPWNGNTGTVTTTDKLSDEQQQSFSSMDVVVVFADTGWTDLSLGGNEMIPDYFPSMFQTEPIIFKRYQLAIWDYTNFWDNDKSLYDDKYASIADSNRRLRGILAKLETTSTQPRPKSRVPSASTKPSSTFTSSRERKSAKKRNRT
jgi:MutS domain V